MRGFPGFGKPKQQRFSMQYGYSARRSMWHEVKMHAHLLIAGIGTVSLIGVAAMAFWLAMPPGEQSAFAGSDEASQAKPPVLASATVTVVPQPATQESDELLQTPVVPKMDPEAAAAIAVPAVKSATSGADTLQQDPAKTAAIPTARPERSVQSTANGPKESAQEETGQETGRILRAVTMRTGPKKSASAIGTVPAKTSVQVISCDKWCQIVYKDKRGFIYKSFLKRGG